MARFAKALSQARRAVWYAPQAKREAMELHVRMVACIALSAIGAQGEVAVNVVQRGSRAIVKGATELGLLVSLEISTTLLSVTTRSHHNDVTHTNAFHDLVFDTVNSLHIQLNLRMSETRTCHLPTMTHPHRQRTVYGGRLHKLMPKPFWLLACRRAGAVSDGRALSPHLLPSLLTIRSVFLSFVRASGCALARVHWWAPG